MPTEKQKQFQHNRPCIFKDAGGVSTRQVQCMQLLKGASLIRLSQLSIDVQAPAHNVRQVHGHASAQFIRAARLRPRYNHSISETQPKIFANNRHRTDTPPKQQNNKNSTKTQPAHHPNMSETPKLNRLTKHDRDTALLKHHRDTT